MEKGTKCLRLQGGVYAANKQQDGHQEHVNKKLNCHSFVNKETTIGALNMRQMSFYELGPLETRAGKPVNQYRE